MARVRLNPLNSKEIHLDHSKHETVHSLFERFFSGLAVQDEKLREFYVVLVDGTEINKELWKETLIGESDVLIAVALRGGSNRGIFKQILVVAAVITVTILTNGAAGPWAAALAASATSIGMTLLTNALFPTVDVGGLGSFGSLGYESESSQTYTISNQSNKTNKYGTVPKPYGTNKMFPNIAANPYTEITTDPTTGRVIQNFYCIYSFGFGPMSVNNIKIGDTDFETYYNASYRLVDLNKPAVNEGTWDEPLNTSFAYYKGDNENSVVTAAINSNQETAGPEIPTVDYQIERNASDKGNGGNQEIILLFTAPSGLTTYGTNGNRATRNIELLIEFAEVGTENWYTFNDTSVASISETTGIVSDTDNVIHVMSNTFTALSSYTTGRNRYTTYGIAKGVTTIDATDYIPNNTFILSGGVVIGKISSSVVISGGWRYTLFSPLETSYGMRTLNEKLTWYCTDYDVESTCSWIASGSSTWSDVSYPWKQQAGTGGTFKISADTTVPAYFSVTMKPFTTNQIKVRVTRVRSYGGFSFRVVDNLTWYSMNTRFDRTPIITSNRILFMEVRIQATDQLNGTIQDLSAIVTSVLNVYNSSTSTWSLQETSNPAWVFADLLTGSINKRSVDVSRLDTDSLLEWEEYSNIHDVGSLRVFEMPRYESNFILDFKSTLNSVITKVTNAAGASINLINGKYGVLIDRKKTTPVQLFTPRNSENFSSVRKYASLPHALKVKYVDGRSDWSVKEEVVYAPGYDENTATMFEDMDTFGCTNNEQAWRYGTYNMAQAVLRQETVDITVDFENLICTRGDYVLLQQDSMRAGGFPSRVKSVSGNDITINDSFVDGGDSYGYTFRGVGGIKSGTLVIVDTDTATLTGDIPSVGDLFVWGIVDSITMDMVVRSINPQANLKANLTLVERANEIFDAESGNPIPDYNPQISKSISDFTPPSEVENLAIDENTWECRGGNYNYYMNITWDIPQSSAVEVYEVYVNSGGGYALEGYSSITSFKYSVLEENLGTAHSVKVLAVDSNGNKITLGQVSAVSDTPEYKTTPPSDVDALFINITNQVIQLDWNIVTDCDIDFYTIRYSPSLTATWISSIPVQNVTATTSSVSFQGRTGSYFIKAIDWNGNESTNAAIALTSIPKLFDLNIIEETNDFPTLPGYKDKVESLESSLVLKEKVTGGAGVVEYYPEGYYTFSTLLDLGEVYTVRLQSLVEAEGYSSDDLMSNWATLSSLTSLTSAATSDWDVETYYRSTENFITMSTWSSLSSVTTLDSGSEDGWTEWRKFTLGDFTGRVFQFRLKLISNKASVTPRVFNGIIRADMPDRIESYNNLVAPIAGYDLEYDPPFKGPGTTPAIQITQDDATQGDYYKITNRTLDGFTIKFYDISNTLVERQFDAIIKGYGRKYSAVL